MRRLWPLLIASLVGCDCQPQKPMDDAGMLGGGSGGGGGGGGGGVDAGVLEVTVGEFGEVLRGSSVDHPVTFRNQRASAVTLDLSVTGAGFSLVGSMTTLQLGTGEEAIVQVRFSPTGLGRSDGMLHYGEGDLPLLGSGVGPALELSPAMIDLGTVPLYDGAAATAVAMLTAQNRGVDGMPARTDTALQLFFEVQATGGAPAEELCVGDCLGGSVSVDVGDSRAIPVQLTSVTAGTKTWDVRVLSNDPSMPMRTVPVIAEVVARPTCQFSVPSSLAFGVVSTAERRDLEVILENVGTENCEVTQVEVGAEMPAQATPVFSVPNPPAGPQTIAPGGVMRVIVRAAPSGMTPAAPTSVTAELRLALNHPSGFARVPLTVELGPTCLLISPSPVDFGAVQPGCRSADRSITLRNTCSRAIGVTSATLPGFSNFSISGPLPAQLAPNATVSVTARYTPFALGPSRDVVDAAWLDVGTTRHTTLPLVGEANATGENVERFAPGTTKLDLLLAIDDSASMMLNIPRLNAQLPRLVTQLLSNNVDFRLGVIDADGSTNGVLRRTASGLRWLTPSTPGLAMQFTELTRFTGLLNNEGCEGAVLRALIPPASIDPALNGGFVRPDSMLSVICISDLTDTNFLLNDLLGAAGAGRRFTWDRIGPIGPGTPQCSSTFVSRAEPTHEQMTGGRLQDVCAADWSPLLDEVAARATSTRPFFPLLARPDLLGTPPLTVNVAGQDVSSATDAGTSVWSWQTTPNAVVFSPAFAPLSTEPVSISYAVSCMP